MKSKDSFFSSIKSILIAVFIALIIRSFIVEPFNIPSGSMKPNLLVGDFIFVSKWSYGYSKHSLPFSINLIPKKIFNKFPKRGDVVVFKTPSDNRTDYIKRVIGISGDKIKIINGSIIINDNLIYKKKINDFIDKRNDENFMRIRQYKEYLFDKEFTVLDQVDNSQVDNTQLYIVPKNHFFVLGDNRDNSADSRIFKNPSITNRVGYVPIENLVGKAQFVWFSFENARFYQVWKWFNSIRYSRIMKKIE